MCYESLHDTITNPKHSNKYAWIAMYRTAVHGQAAQPIQFRQLASMALCSIHISAITDCEHLLQAQSNMQYTYLHVSL